MTLYGRSNCHLCEDMQKALQEFGNDIDFELSIVDIDTDPDLLEKYADFIPVLMAGSTQICHYSLNLQALRSHFRQRAE